MRELNLEIKLDGDGLGTPAERELRYHIQEQIEERGIGVCTGSGAGGGYMDISIEAKRVGETTRQLDDLMRELGVKAYDIRVHN